jgi:hypothetical protein
MNELYEGLITLPHLPIPPAKRQGESQPGILRLFEFQFLQWLVVNKESSVNIK